MKAKRIMLVAGEASGDCLAAELVKALRDAIPEIQFQPNGDFQPLTTPLPPEFFGAGGRQMAAAGVKLAVDMTQHAVTGLTDAVKNYPKFRQIFHKLLQLAVEREPDLIICVDFPSFNLRFEQAIRNYLRQRQGSFFNWSPRIVHYSSPQVWASRPRRANVLEHNVDLLLCLLPFEKKWYAEHAAGLKVEFVGHPVVDRLSATRDLNADSSTANRKSQILLLPGSRRGELQRHLPVMLEASRQILGKHDAHLQMVLPNENLLNEARFIAPDLARLVNVHIGNLERVLPQTSLAIASTGTVLLECAYFGVPTVAIYKTSWLTFQIGKRIATVKYLSMPNILAGELIYPEFIQDDATAENITREALDLLTNEPRRKRVKSQLAQIISSLGGAGASKRAARAILEIMGWVWNPDLRAALASR